MSEETTPAYISKVHLKGFKSIIDTECTFKPGLNIIIGDNGSGKSNFLDFLLAALNNNNHDVLNGIFFWDIFTVENKNVLQHQRRRDINITQNSTNRFLETEKICKNNQQLKPHPSAKGPFYFYLPRIKIIYGIEHSFEDFSKFLNFQYLKLEYPRKPNQELLSNFSETTNNPIINKIIHANSFALLQIKKGLNDQKIKNYIDNLLIENTDYFSNYLNSFSNIQSIKVAEKFEITTTDKNINVDFLHFEFKINNNWHKWHDLSDGTKRLFYIISTISLHEEGIFLIEEPELGIHPDQLFKLMSFLKEQAQTKQIIISTHSPEILNHLKRDELDRIIICKHEGEAGTKMYHLEEKEKEHMKTYMVEDGFLSDYWVYEGFDIEQEKE